MQVPVLSRALKEQKGEYKRRASMVVGNMCGLVIDGKVCVHAYASLSLTHTHTHSHTHTKVFVTQCVSVCQYLRDSLSVCVC